MQICFTFVYGTLIFFLSFLNQPDLFHFSFRQLQRVVSLHTDQVLVSLIFVHALFTDNKITTAISQSSKLKYVK